MFCFGNQSLLLYVFFSVWLNFGEDVYLRHVNRALSVFALQRLVHLSPTVVGTSNSHVASCRRSSHFS